MRTSRGSEVSLQHALCGGLKLVQGIGRQQRSQSRIPGPGVEVDDRIVQNGAEAMIGYGAFGGMSDQHALDATIGRLWYCLCSFRKRKRFRRGCARSEGRDPASWVRSASRFREQADFRTGATSTACIRER